MKRALDVSVSGVGLLVLSPLLVVVALLVRTTSAGPALYTQERVGRGGTPFRLYKFRSMRRGADASGPLVTGGGDPRVTRVGRVLRRTKIDELPQLWNVLRGDMSLVGPRPEVARYVAHYTPAQRRVLQVRPGITDPATLRFRDEESILRPIPAPQREAYYLSEVLPQKLAMNLEYIDNAGFIDDLRILARTVLAVLKGPGADRGTKDPAA